MDADGIHSPDRSASDRRRVTTYYHRDGVIVTDRWFCSDGKWYAIGELHDLLRAERAANPGTIAAMVIASAQALAVVLIAVAFGATAALLVGACSVVVPIVVGVAWNQRWPAYHELLATYRGTGVRLFVTRDALEFGRVCRAVRRAVDAATERQHSGGRPAANSCGAAA